MWKRVLCILFDHRITRVQSIRYGALVTCGRCERTWARW